MKICKQCGIEKSIKQYYSHKFTKDGLRSVCKDCARIQNIKWVKNNPNKVSRRRRKTIYERFGVTEELYQNFLEKQHGGCAICGKNNSNAVAKHLSIDHCHKTGRIRGLLCFNCNTGLGCFKDDIDLIQTAINYLEECKRDRKLEKKAAKEID